MPDSRDLRAGRELQLEYRLDAVERRLDQVMARLGPPPSEPLPTPPLQPHKRAKGLHYHPANPPIAQNLIDKDWDRF